MGKSLECPFCGRGLSKHFYERNGTRCCWECKNAKTYGEAIIMSRQEGEAKNGVMVLDMPKHMPRMSRALAVEYYNDKLEGYWIENMDKRIPKRLRKRALNYLLGRKGK